ncbi:MAG: SDR family oxidoreductase [Myxococcota bacterium]|nr:SDR family oxidoreductase [Myxococcota bacterium]
MELTNQVALVTGSSRGIGAAIAKRFAAAGAKVVLHGRDEQALSTVHRAIEAAGGQAMYVPADVTKLAELEVLRGRAEEQFGPVDVLVANAGGNTVRPHLSLEEIPEEGFRASLDGNLIATFLTLKCFVPGMKTRKAGNIITVSSAASRRPTAFSPLAYAAAKAGIELLTQHAALQLGPFNIRVNCIAPETILTEKADAQIPAAQKAEMIEKHPLRRLGTPEDVAEAALYLASDGAGWVSGIVLDVAGGSVLAR